jgi:signal peptidase I
MEIIKNKLFRLVLLLFLLALAFHSSLKLIWVSGSSMEPWYKNGDIILIDVLSYRFKPIKRYDIVIVKTEGEIWVKRIIGLPNEKIEFKDGEFFINGKLLNKDFYKKPELTNFEITSEKIKKNYYFVIGDNRNDSAFGFFHKDEIVGKVFY